MIEVENLRRAYRSRRRGTMSRGDLNIAVDDLSFTVTPGLVTGFVGPNGAGKTTTMRMIAGLERPTSGRALVDGRPIGEHRAPMQALGALLDAKAIHPGRSIRAHLRILAATARLGDTAVEEVLALVGLLDVADRRIGALSLGMGQRVGLAGVLLGDPETVMLDEPLNGLDPVGIAWMRRLMRTLAEQGRAVLVSSHLMSEMALTADHLVVVGRGRLLADESLEAFMARAAPRAVLVRSPAVGQLQELLRTLAQDAEASSAPSPGTPALPGDPGGGVALVRRVPGSHDGSGPRVVRPLNSGAFEVLGLSAEQIGLAAAAAGVPLAELTTQRASLEETVTTLTAQASDFQ